jgi:two-component system, NarL family, response regulator DevR
MKEAVGVTIRVFVLDDHEVVRAGIRELFHDEADIEIVGEAATAAQARARVPALRPDVAILDVRLPDGNGVEVCRDLRASTEPPPACLMLTSYSDDRALFDAIMAGASGYLLKQIDSAAMIMAVRRLAIGESMLDPALTLAVLDRLRKPPEEDPRYASLSEQERNILELVADGMTNKEIARQLHLADKTVKNYVSSMLRKLGMERRTEAAVFAVQLRQGTPLDR